MPNIHLPVTLQEEYWVNIIYSLGGTEPYKQQKASLSI